MAGNDDGGVSRENVPCRVRQGRDRPREGGANSAWEGGNLLEWVTHLVLRTVCAASSSLECFWEGPNMRAPPCSSCPLAGAHVGLCAVVMVRRSVRSSRCGDSLPACVIPLANTFDFTNLSCNTYFVRVCCCCCIIFVMTKSSPTQPLLDAYRCIYAYTRPLSPTHLHEEASAQARVDSPAEKPSGTKPTGLGTRTDS